MARFATVKTSGCSGGTLAFAILASRTALVAFLTLRPFTLTSIFSFLGTRTRLTLLFTFTLRDPLPLGLGPNLVVKLCQALNESFQGSNWW